MKDFTNIYGERMYIRKEDGKYFIRHTDVGESWYELFEFIKKFVISKDEQKAIISFIELPLK